MRNKSITYKSSSFQKKFIVPGSTESLRVLLDAKSMEFKKDQVLPYHNVWKDEGPIGQVQKFEKLRIIKEKYAREGSGEINFYEHILEIRAYEDVYLRGNNFFTNDYYLDVDPWSSPRLDSAYGLLNDVFVGMHNPNLVLGNFRQSLHNGRVDEIVVIFGKYLNNYWHFMCEYLPKLHLVRPGQLVLIPRDLRKDFLDILLKLLSDLSIDYFVQPKHSSKFKKVIFIKPPVLNLKNQTFSFNFDAIHWLSQRIVKIESTYSPGNGESSHGIYFFERKSPRRIMNDSPLIRLAKKEGYTVVNPANLSVSEQIWIFRNAKAVIGYPGANWASIIFAHKNLVVYNIVDERLSVGFLHHVLASRFKSKLFDICYKRNHFKSLSQISYNDLDRKGSTIKSYEARFLLDVISKDIGTRF